MALVKDGKVVESRPLIPAFTVEKVLAKPGRAANGIRFVRLVGIRRNYTILQID
jgi:hypothetical protein